MRRRLTVAVALVAAAGIWVWFKPPSSAVAPEDQAAQHVATYTWSHDADWFGGISGIELQPDGTSFLAVTDKGMIFAGTLERTEGILTDVVVERFQPLVDKNGDVRDFPHTDAEGLALDAQGRVLVSFEHAHRILRYDTWESAADWPSYTRAWRAFSSNGGMEFLAVDLDGSILTIPETSGHRAAETLVYRRYNNSRWEQPYTLPLSDGYSPVGGDITPEGKLYLLERDHYSFGFKTRVREMTPTPDGFTDIRTVLETDWGDYGNLEGLAVSKDDQGRTRLTMVSDNNFLFFQRTHIVEYVLTDGLAQAD